MPPPSRRSVLDAQPCLVVWIPGRQPPIHIDDFGTGYSSLSCLHSFPIDLIKIDRAFVRTIDSRREYAAVVHAIITLARNLGMEVVGEGVETADDLTMLQALDCDYVQGFYFSEPTGAAEIAALSALESIVPY